MPDHIRVSAKAVVVAGGRVLLLRHRDRQGDWFSLPGGGQRHGETLTDALVRECLEETGLQVRPGRLLFVRDYIAQHHEFADEDGNAHQVELMFECQLAASEPPRLGEQPDEMQIGAEWVSIEDLAGIRMYPQAVARLLESGVPDAAPVYLGDVN